MTAKLSTSPHINCSMPAGLKPMRLAYLAAAPVRLARANVIQTLRMCDALVAIGHEVVLVADFEGVPDQDLRERFGVTRELQRRQVRTSGPPGFGYYVALRAAWLAKRVRADIVYTRHARALLFLTLLRCPAVFEAHKAPQDLVERFALWVAARSGVLRGVVTISEALRQALDLDVPTQVAHDGASLPTAQPEKVVVSSDPKDFRVGYVGSPYPGKGADFVVRLARSAPHIRFVIAGGDAAQLGCAGDIPPNLDILGRISPVKALELQQQLDVLLAPYAESVSSAGGDDIAKWMSPLKIFEYMAAGKAIVASDLPVLREVLRHNSNALLVPPLDPKAWLTAIETLRGDRQMRAQLGECAREELLEKYTWSARAEAVSRFIEKECLPMHPIYPSGQGSAS